MSARTAPMLAWSASLDRDALTTDGYDVVEFSALRREIAAGIRQAGRRRTSLVNPADTWLARVDRAAGLAVMGVRLRDLADTCGRCTATSSSPRFAPGRRWRSRARSA
jgi:hypothetical protein